MFDTLYWKNLNNFWKKQNSLLQGQAGNTSGLFLLSFPNRKKCMVHLKACDYLRKVYMLGKLSGYE